MHSSMMFKSGGLEALQSALSSAVVRVSATGVVCGGGEEEVSAVRFSGFGDHNVLSSRHIMSSALIGVDVTVTGVTGVGFDLAKAA